MDDLDFFEGIRGAPEKEAAREFFGKLKTSGLKQKAVEFATRNAPEIGGALVGGAGIGTATYLRNRKKKDGLSAEQRSSDEALKKYKDPKGFTAETSHASAKFRKDLSDVFAKHPGRAALLASPLGAQLGATLARKLLK